MEPLLSPAELVAARARFEQDQEDAEYVEYTQAMERIAAPRRWRRARRRFLTANGYQNPRESLD
ncbi:hypothetical protein BJF78_26040 [Pseudonocardia sp. CNS-139]|nr:hypothetical protein BJF78_26040 [Pseudonocardia sp. CNS-139]